MRNRPGRSAPYLPVVEPDIAKLTYRGDLRNKGEDRYALSFQFIDGGGDQRVNRRDHAHSVAGLTQCQQFFCCGLRRQIGGELYCKVVAPRLSLTELVEIGGIIPTVVLGLHVPEERGFDTIRSDDLNGADGVARHLVESGRKDIAHLALELPSDIEGALFMDREYGYRNAMRALGLSRFVRVVTAAESSAAIQQAARRLLSGRRPPQAIFCWTDYVAFEVLSVAHSLGLNVPNDLAIVGYDNTHSCTLEQNSLTSVDQFGSDWGRQGAAMLIDRIKGRQVPRHVLTTPRLVARKSSAPVDLG